MNRSIGRVGLAIVLAGFALAAFPIVLTGAEHFDIEQEAGILVAPVGLLVILIGAVQVNPERTTVGGTFGNPEERSRLRAGPSATPSLPPRARWSPGDPIYCRYCHTSIHPELARCPRCARARDCRSCGRPLGLVLERATCPFCGRAEPLCYCSPVPRPAAAPGLAARPRRG